MSLTRKSFEVGLKIPNQHCSYPTMSTLKAILPPIVDEFDFLSTYYKFRSVVHYFRLYSRRLRGQVWYGRTQSIICFRM